MQPMRPMQAMQAMQAVQAVPDFLTRTAKERRSKREERRGKREEARSVLVSGALSGPSFSCPFPRQHTRTNTNTLTHSPSHTHLVAPYPFPFNHLPSLISTLALSVHYYYSSPPLSSLLLCAPVPSLQSTLFHLPFFGSSVNF